MVPDGPRVRLGWLEYVRIINMFFNVSTSINMYSINMSLEYQGPPMSFVQVWSDPLVLHFLPYDNMLYSRWVIACQPSCPGHTHLLIVSKPPVLTSGVIPAVYRSIACSQNTPSLDEQFCGLWRPQTHPIWANSHGSAWRSSLSS
jgi:hypothetical protein